MQIPTTTATSDPVITALEDLLHAQESTLGRCRLAGVLRLAIQARHEDMKATNDNSPAALAPFRLRQAKQYLDENLCNQIRLEDVAACAGLSASHFCRQFKRATGKSPIRYVLDKRIERAKHLILDTDTPLASVALEVGFSSQSHFTVIFRKLAGVPPRRFRELYR